MLPTPSSSMGALCWALRFGFPTSKSSWASKRKQDGGCRKMGVRGPRVLGVQELHSGWTVVTLVQQ